MYHFKDIIAGYSINTIPQADLAKGIAGFHKVFDHVEAHDKDTFWDAMKEFHECVKGEHFDEKIIHSAINFWFEDEDAGSGKVWNYFKDI